MKQDQRIRKKKDFEELARDGQRFFARLFILNFRKNGLPYSRIGIVISSKVSKRAVKRNLVRRRIRESMRLRYDRLKPGYDIAIIASKKMIDNERPLPFEHIDRELERALINTHLIA